MRFVVGSMVGANLRLVRKLGEGGMGSVWVADHLTLETQVAVKFMSETLVKDGEAVARFTKEATAAAKVKSRHVVQTLDFGLTGDGVPYIVMELLEGEDLGSRLARVGRLSLAETSAVVLQTCKALAQAHGHGIVHRDIKPENIFFTEADGDSVLKVLDFGIAKRLDVESPVATSAGAMIGTPLYMSPEQILGSKDVRDASDIWSLGVVAYQSLTGALPFTGETLGAIIVAVNEAVHAPPSQLRPDIPAAVDDWMARALARDPTRRFASAREMSDQLAETVAEVSTLTLAEELVSSAPSEPPPASPSALLQPTFLGAAVTHPVSASPTEKVRRRLATPALMAAGALAVLVVTLARRPSTATVMSPIVAGSTAPVAPPASAYVEPVAPAALPSAAPLTRVRDVEFESLPAATPTRVVDSAPPLPAPSASAGPKPTVTRKKDRGF